MRKQLPLYQSPAVPKLACGMDIYESRALLPKEQSAILLMLGPKNDIPLRCAAANVVAKLGLTQASPIMDGMLNGGALPHCLIDVFRASIASLRNQARDGELPHPEEQLMLLVGMRNSENPVERGCADRVLNAGDIKFGSPVPEFGAWKAEPEFEFRAGEEEKTAKWRGLARLKVAPKASKDETGSG